MNDDPLVGRLVGLRAIEPERAFADRLRFAVGREFLAERERAGRPGWRRALTSGTAWRLASALAVLALLVGGTSQVLAASADSPFYPARVTAEGIVLAVLPADQRAARLAILIRERQSEAVRLDASAPAAASVARAARDAAERAYEELVRPEPAHTARPLPATAPERPDVTVPLAAPQPNQTLFSGRFVTPSGAPIAGICVTLGTAQCAATTDTNGRFSLSATVSAGTETPLRFYAPSGQVLGALRFSASGGPVQVFGDISAAATAVPSASPSAAPTSRPATTAPPLVPLPAPPTVAPTLPPLPSVVPLGFGIPLPLGPATPATPTQPQSRPPCEPT